MTRPRGQSWRIVGQAAPAAAAEGDDDESSGKSAAPCTERRPASGAPRVPMDPAAMLDRLADPSADLSEEDLQLLLAVLHAALGVLEGGPRKQVVLGAAVLSLSLDSRRPARI